MVLEANADLSARDEQLALAQFIVAGPTDTLPLLEAARSLGVDPLDYLARSLALGEGLVFERAAQWAGLPFDHDVPQTLRGSATHLRLESLSNARAVHTVDGASERTYFAPTFDEVLTLRRNSARAAARGIVVAPPRAIRRALVDANAPTLLVESRQRLSRRWPKASASLDLSKPLRIAFVAALAGIIAFTALMPLFARPLLLPFLLVVIVAPALLRLLATVHRPPEQTDPDLPAQDLPRYSILVPLRDEAAMVPQLCQALAALDYPAEKLDIIFLVESRSPETVEAVEAHLGDARFELIVVPDGPPHTKPKALDYALPMVRGAFVVVFDAEDIPARDQLRKAAGRFAAHPEFDCLQAELRIDNGAENWLTALFAGEYAGLFSLLLPYLAEHRLPLPLGGTSNHFRTATLRAVGGWDAFNVTEDADLGVRLARMRSRTGTLRVATGEEAPIRLGAWMRQRTRWIKGWMQTFLVHNRHPRAFLRDIGWRGFLFFQIYVGSLIASSLIHTVFATTVAIQIALFGVGWLRLTDPWDVGYLLVLAIGYGGAFGIALVGLARQEQSELAVYQVLLPVYWLLHAVAAVRASIELLVRPYFWSKTRHGETRLSRVVR
jgi:cellulose synthase/poly-beta-1,6-N-acetylglucosamine synthase-like glycosyltransferase